MANRLNMTSWARIYRENFFPAFYTEKSHPLDLLLKQLGIVGKLNFANLLSSSLLKGHCQRCFVCHKERFVVTVLYNNNNINLNYFWKNLGAAGEDHLHYVDLTDVQVDSWRNEVICLCPCSEQPAVKNRSQLVD